MKLNPKELFEDMLKHICLHVGVDYDRDFKEFLIMREDGRLKFFIKARGDRVWRRFVDLKKMGGEKDVKKTKG